MSDEGVSQVTKSQADRQFPKQFADKKYITASQLKKDDLISRLQVNNAATNHTARSGLCLQFLNSIAEIAQVPEEGGRCARLGEREA
jgi:hypothetical protein